MLTQTTHRFGGYENLNLTQAEIGARAYNAGLPPSDRPLNSYSSVTWTPCKLMLDSIPVPYAVAIAAEGVLLWRHTDGTVVQSMDIFTGSSIFALSGGIGIGLYNANNGLTYIAYTVNNFIDLPNETGRYLRSQAVEHDYWGSSWGAPPSVAIIEEAGGA